MAATENTSASAHEILTDVFKRADKNDDGEISVAEFLEFFADDVATKEELEALFKEVDTNNNGTISPDELSAYFSGKLESFSGSFDHLNHMNSAVLAALQGSHGTDLSTMEQFPTRFFVRELLDHLSALQDVLTASQTAMVNLAMKARPGKVPHHTTVVEHEAPMSRTASAHSGPSDSFHSEVERLAGLVDKLAATVPPKIDSTITSKTDLPMAYTLTFKLAVNEAKMHEFKTGWEAYCRALEREVACNGVRATYEDKGVVLYIVFSSEEDLESHCQKPAYKAFQQCAVSCAAGALSSDIKESPAFQYV